MAESESSREVRLDDPPDGPEEPDEWAAPPPLDPEERTFDAFDAGTWNFMPAPSPWYRTGHTPATMVVVSMAAVALVVSVVLLAFRGPPREDDAPTAGTTTPSTAQAPVTTSAVPPSPPPPPPPPPPSAAQITQAPVIVRTSPKPTKKPEINVTRSSLSVAPPKPSNR